MGRHLGSRNGGSCGPGLASRVRTDRVNVTFMKPAHFSPLGPFATVLRPFQDGAPGAIGGPDSLAGLLPFCRMGHQVLLHLEIATISFRADNLAGSHNGRQMGLAGRLR